jgi:hypothetical protein
LDFIGPITEGSVIVWKRAVALLVGGITLAHAQGISAWYSYAEWERLPDELKQAYIAGAFDSLGSLANSEGDMKAAKHYGDCITNGHVEIDELTNNIEIFAHGRSDLPGTVQAAMVSYLIRLCGMPPK